MYPPPHRTHIHTLVTDLFRHMYPPPHRTHTHTLVTDLFRNNSKYLDLLRSKGKAVYMNDGYNQVLPKP
jgi:hypothetical protein